MIRNITVFNFIGFYIAAEITDDPKSYKWFMCMTSLLLQVCLARINDSDDLRELVERQLRSGGELGAGVELALAASRHVVLPDPGVYCVIHLRRAQ